MVAFSGDFRIIDVELLLPDTICKLCQPSHEVIILWCLICFYNIFSDLVLNLTILKQKSLRNKVKEAVDIHAYFGSRK